MIGTDDISHSEKIHDNNINQYQDYLNTDKKLEQRIEIKPLSVNECWQGKRFKTEAYKNYEKAVLLMLKASLIPPAPYHIYFEFGMSNVLSDWDNPVKPLQDILQKKYRFNDKDIMSANVLKIKVDKGKEYFKFSIKSI